MKTCPHCGYERNRQSVRMCGLCGYVFTEMWRTGLPKADSNQSDVPADFAAKANPFKTSRPSKKLDSSMAGIQSVRTDFAALIRSNTRNSFLLLTVLVLLLILLGYGIGGMYGFPYEGVLFGMLLAAIMIGVAWISGDSIILKLAGARPADSVMDRKLINVVDEMRIAAGLPMPAVYVIDSAAANAFATGRSPETATVAATSGLIELLNREELQGVVAHEISHIRNYDIRYMMLVAALVGAIVMLADFFRHSWWWGGAGGGRSRWSGRGRGGGGGNVIGLVMVVITVLLIILAPVFASMLQMAISRKRELLADSSAVELTRNPDALANALEKLDNRVETEGPIDPGARAIQHLYIVNPFHQFGQNATALFSTHPPLEARIRILRSMT